MTPLLEKILTILCLFLIGSGIIAGLLQFAIYFNSFWSYPIGLGLSILVVLAGFEIVERIYDGK
jgi:hypothetical protein